MTLASRITQVTSSQKFLRGLLVGGGGALVLALAGGLYYRNTVTQAARAQKAFSDTFEAFEKALSAENNPDALREIEQAWATGSLLYAKTPLAPYFRAFQAETLLREGKTAEARRLMHEMLDTLSHSSPLYYLYALKTALMDSDAQDQTTHEAGLQALTALAEDQHNPQRDIALYNLGYVSWMAGDYEQAQKIWARLIRESGSSSPWAGMAQSKLSQLFQNPAHILSP